MIERLPSTNEGNPGPLLPEVRRALAILSLQDIPPYAHWGARALSQFAPEPRIFDERYKRLAEAAAFCDACEVREECLEDALATNSKGEFRAGMTSAEREALKKRRRAQ